MVLGISGSPRENGITAHAVKEVLAKSQGDTRYISLCGKKITGCISCLGCIKDNQCVVNDDFLEIAEAMVQADAIILGVPNYFDTLNALTHAMLERCFCFRHQGTFSLKDKPIVIFSTGYSKDEDNNPVLKTVENFAKRNKMQVIKKFLVGAFSQCYTCDYGLTCTYGKVVRDHGVVDQLTEEMLPPKFKQQEDAIIKCQGAADAINSLLV